MVAVRRYNTVVFLCVFVYNNMMSSRHTLLYVTTFHCMSQHHGMEINPNWSQRCHYIIGHHHVSKSPTDPCCVTIVSLIAPCCVITVSLTAPCCVTTDSLTAPCCVTTDSLTAPCCVTTVSLTAPCCVTTESLTAPCFVTTTDSTQHMTL